MLQCRIETRNEEGKTHCDRSGVRKTHRWCELGCRRWCEEGEESGTESETNSERSETKTIGKKWGERGGDDGQGVGCTMGCGAGFVFFDLMVGKGQLWGSDGGALLGSPFLFRNAEIV